MPRPRWIGSHTMSRLAMLGLGAAFGFVGSPMPLAGALAGDEGVAEAIGLPTREVDIATALLGIDCLAELTEVDLLRGRGGSA